MKIKLNQRRGSSMLIAIGLGALLILIVIGALSAVLSALKSTQRLESSNIAYFVAEGGVELALYDIGRRGTGYEVSANAYENGWQDVDDEDGEYSHLISNNAVLDDIIPSDDKYAMILPEDTEGWWSVRSLTKMQSANKYVIPAQGEGTAGENCELTDDWVNNDSHPCNWNKMNIVSSAVISLYRDPNDPTDNPTKREDYEHFQDIVSALNENSLVVKLRIPEEYDELTVDKESELTGDETVVSWFFSGQNSEDQANEFVFSDATFDKKSDGNYRTDCNSEITASLLSNARNGFYGVNDAGFTDIDDALNFNLGLHGINTYREGGNLCDEEEYSVLKTLLGEDGTYTEFQNLHLGWITNIKDLDDKSVENIEYQIISNGQIPDAYITIDAEGFVGNYPQVYRQHIRMRVKQNSSVPIFDFAFVEG